MGVLSALAPPPAPSHWRHHHNWRHRPAHWRHRGAHVPILILGLCALLVYTGCTAGTTPTSARKPAPLRSNLPGVTCMHRLRMLFCERILHPEGLDRSDADWHCPLCKTTLRPRPVQQRAVRQAGIDKTGNWMATQSSASPTLCNRVDPDTVGQSFS